MVSQNGQKLFTRKINGSILQIRDTIYSTVTVLLTLVWIDLFLNQNPGLFFLRGLSATENYYFVINSKIYLNTAYQRATY